VAGSWILTLSDFDGAERCVSFWFSFGAWQSWGFAAAQTFLAGIPVIPGYAKFIPD
jgi:hypothetical protein